VWNAAHGEGIREGQIAGLDSGRPYSGAVAGAEATRPRCRTARSNVVGATGSF